MSLAFYTYREGSLDTEQSIVDQPKVEKKDRLTGTNLFNRILGIHPCLSARI